ncbi:MAG TPA: PIG-L family deacetylase, partial [Thermoanaerobaculia bacterium]
MTSGVLFVFAHQDDEVAAATRIAFERSQGNQIHCAFLTDGDERRQRESLAVLAGLGVDGERIAFLGNAERIADQALIHSLERALTALERWLEKTAINTVYCLAFEGGHHDHDASHLVAMAFAARRAILDRCFEVPLYRGIGSRGPFFRVFSPVGEGWQQRPIEFIEGVRVAALSFRY